MHLVIGHLIGFVSLCCVSAVATECMQWCQQIMTDLCLGSPAQHFVFFQMANHITFKRHIQKSSVLILPSHYDFEPLKGIYLPLFLCAFYLRQKKVIGWIQLKMIPILLCSFLL